MIIYSGSVRILAIDPGFGRMGVAVIEHTKGGQKPLVTYSTCVTTNPKDEFGKRLKEIGEVLENVIKKYKPEVLAIEKLFFSTNQKTALQVAEARGVVVYEASRHNLSIFEYTPIQIKAAVSGYGRATKDQVIYMIPNLVDFKDRKIPTSSRTPDFGKAKIGTKKASDDEFDAIAIGVTHIAHYNPVLANA